MSRQNTSIQTSSSNKNNPNRGLRRELNLLDAVAIGLGAVIGAGIFVVSGQAAGIAGPSMLLSLVVAGIAASANGLSSAQLASLYPQSGGTYEYGYELLSPWAGFAAGWMFLTSKLAAGAVVALGFASYIGELFPTLPRKGTAVAIVVLLVLANLLGIKKAGLLNRFIVSLTVLLLLVFVVMGLSKADSANLTPFMTGGFTGFIEASAMMFFAFTGYARVATLGEEIKEPRRNIPRAVVITLALSLVLYLAVAGTALAGVGAETMAASASPLVAAAAGMGFPLLGKFLSLAAATAMLGVLLSQILGVSRMFFAMSKRADLPPVFAQVSQWSAVPAVGIVTAGAIIIVLVLVGEIRPILLAASFTILLYYSIANLAALRVSPEQRFLPRFVSVIGLIFCLAMSISLEPAIILSGLGILLFGFLYRLIYRRLARV